jgi:hypothetical protein
VRVALLDCFGERAAGPMRIEFHVRQHGNRDAREQGSGAEQAGRASIAGQEGLPGLGSVENTLGRGTAADLEGARVSTGRSGFAKPVEARP